MRSVAALFGAPVRAVHRVVGRGQERRKLARSARRFSLRLGAQLEERLSFVATLVRAGEIGAARRLLQEFEDDVRKEGAALVSSIERLGTEDLER